MPLGRIAGKWLGGYSYKSAVSPPTYVDRRPGYDEYRAFRIGGPTPLMDPPDAACNVGHLVNPRPRMPADSGLRVNNRIHME